MFNFFSKKDLQSKWLAGWDLLAITFVFAIIFAVGWWIQQITLPSTNLHNDISLQPRHLIYYSLKSVGRMFIAICFSLLATLLFGTWAAKSRRAEKILLPLIDIFQSVPVLGFLEISAWLFMLLFPTSFTGLECAAIFTVFTAQAWNMILSFYQSLKILPKNWQELSSMYRLTPWQKFWRIEVPFSMPGLLWNTMISLSSGWFFIVASEVVTIAHQQYHLPGIGSYIALATHQEATQPLYYAIGAMFLIILCYDQLLFRPANYWVLTVTNRSCRTPWVVRLYHHSRLSTFIPFKSFMKAWLNIWPMSPVQAARQSHPHYLANIFYFFWCLLFIFAAGWISLYLYKYISITELLETLKLGLYTAIRVFILIIVCLLIWVPIGIKIGQKPRLSAWLQPIIQFLAAFPPQLLYPLFTFFIIHYHLNPNIWLSPLMILGTQWYILFNVVAGMQAIPESTQAAVKLIGLRHTLKWTKWYLPSIFPSLVTGVITASGGAWNASIEAEQVFWGKNFLSAQGLGAYIKQASSQGDIHRLTLGIVVMCLWVFVINQLLWIPLYRIAQQRYRF